MQEFKSNGGQEPQGKAPSEGDPKLCNLKLLRAYAGVLFSLLLLMVCSLAWMVSGFSTAWFSANKEVSGSGMSTSIASPTSVTTQVEVFSVAGKDGNTLYFSKENINENGSVTMPRYDIFNEADRYLLMKIDISNPNGEKMSLSINTDTDYFMDASHPLLGTDTSGNCNCHTTYQNSLSSIVYFTLPSVSDENFNGSTCHSLSLGDAQFQSLIDREGKQAPITLVKDFTDTTKTIYVLIAYNVDNINYIYSLNIGNDALGSDIGEGSDIIFNSDIYFGLDLTKEEQGG